MEGSQKVLRTPVPRRGMARNACPPRASPLASAKCKIADYGHKSYYGSLMCSLTLRAPMKRIAAREAKNRFGQLIDDAQHEPVTIEKNGRPIAVVMSLGEYEATEAMKLELLRRDVAESDADLAAGRVRALNQDTLDETKAAACRQLSERRRG